MSTTMFSRTGGSEFPSYLKCMVTGPPKSGKTTLLGTVPNILVLDTEPHANNLQSVAHLDLPFKAIYSTNDLRQVQFILSQDQFRQQAAAELGMPAIEAVAIDTLDTLQGIMKKERMREMRQTQFFRDDWGWLKEEMTALLESFLALPMHVFFIVHTKTKDIGTEKNPQTIILPGLEGSIAESIAGMVGYSLLSFRQEQVNPDGTTGTKYLLRAEGNDTYQYLGNRAAGRLPDVIEPDFKTIFDAAMAHRPTAQHEQVAVTLAGVQTTGQIAQQPQQPALPAAPPAAPAAQIPSQPTTTATSTAVPSPEVAQTPPPQSAPPAQQPQQGDLPADDEPVNGAALGFVKRVYDALQMPFPEDKIKALNLGQARQIVRLFKALEADAAQGKGNPREEMIAYLDGNGLMPDAPAEPEKKVEPKIDGTIDEVKAWVNLATTDAGLLDRANQAFEKERTGGNRKSLMAWLESKGASHGGASTPASAPAPEAAQPVQQAPVQTPVETPAEAPQAPQEAVTPAAPAADAPVTEVDEKVSLVQENLGGAVIGQEINPNAVCEVCGNQIDDVELATLGHTRFKKVLCVADYINETKKPRG